MIFGFIVTFFIGMIFGVLLFALLAVASYDDDWNGRG